MKILFGAMAVALAAGCAAPAETDLRDVDHTKVTAIEDTAARNGVRVYWVNPPRKAPR
ncbi:MAG TPA: hypothetical protein VIV54_10340 [Burkholderiales bacterium]